MLARDRGRPTSLKGECRNAHRVFDEKCADSVVVGRGVDDSSVLGERWKFGGEDDRSANLRQDALKPKDDATKK